MRRLNFGTEIGFQTVHQDDTGIRPCWHIRAIDAADPRIDKAGSFTSFRAVFLKQSLTKQGTMMTEADDIVRLMELSSLLQHYRESVQRWEDAKKMNEAREHLFAARQRGLLSTDLQDAERDRQIAEYDSMEAEEKRQKIDPRKLYHSERSPDDDCRIAREAVQRCESALEKWVPSLNEFFEKAIKLGIEYKMPEIMKIRASRMMPHRINGFDWNQFSVELAEVEERADALRKGNQQINARKDDPPAGDQSKQWPIGEGWEFRPGECAYDGIVFKITGQPAAALQLLARRSGQPIRKIAILEAIDPDGFTSDIKDALAAARTILRKEFGLPSTVDPIPNVQKGRDCAWKLDEKVFSQSTKILR